MKEVIVKMTSDHIKVKNGEYVQDLVRCKDCKNKKFCIIYEGLCDDNAFCSCGKGAKDEVDTSNGEVAE